MAAKVAKKIETQPYISILFNSKSKIMEKEEIIARLKEAYEKKESVTVTVRTQENETQEVPLEMTGCRGDRSGRWWKTWEVAKDKETKRDVILKTFVGVDTRGNRTMIAETYRVENVEGFSLGIRD